MILSFLFALLLLVLACATPQTKAPLIPTENILEEAVLQLEPAFRKTMKKRARIERIASPILSKNAELCKSRMKYGFSYIDSITTSNLDPAYPELYMRYYNLPAIYSIPTIVEIEPGSPAEKAGLQVGDRVKKVNNKKVRAVKGNLVDRDVEGKKPQLKSNFNNL